MQSLRYSILQGTPSPKKVFNDGKDRKVKYTAKELTNETTYYYRVAAENEDGAVYGDEAPFTTRR